MRSVTRNFIEICQYFSSTQYSLYLDSNLNALNTLKRNLNLKIEVYDIIGTKPTIKTETKPTTISPMRERSFQEIIVRVQRRVGRAEGVSRQFAYVHLPAAVEKSIPKFYYHFRASSRRTYVLPARLFVPSGRFRGVLYFPRATSVARSTPVTVHFSEDS